jgi:hypothetical protein
MYLCAPFVCVFSVIVLAYISFLFSASFCAAISFKVHVNSVYVHVCVVHMQVIPNDTHIQ